MSGWQGTWRDGPWWGKEVQSRVDPGEGESAGDVAEGGRAGRSWEWDSGRFDGGRRGQHGSGQRTQGKHKAQGFPKE